MLKKLMLYKRVKQRVVIRSAHFLSRFIGQLAPDSKKGHALCNRHYLFIKNIRSS